MLPILGLYDRDDIFGRHRPRSERARLEILEAAYKLLKDKGINVVGSHEIAQAAGVSSATLYRWWNSKEEILFDACFEHMKPVLAISEAGSALTRLRRYVLRAREFLVVRLAGGKKHSL